MGIESFHDLEVYNNSDADCLKVIKDVLPKLPPEEKYDFRDQFSLIDSYDKTGRMIYNLGKSWTTFTDDRRNRASEP